MPARRESAVRRDEILCALARQVPPERGDSPLALARWLKERETLGFRGLDVTISDNDERLAFEHWVRGSNQGTLAKRIQRAFRAGQETKNPKPAPVPLPPLVWPRGMRERNEREPKFKLPWLYGDHGGSEKVFLECLGTRPLLDVTVSLDGQRVAFVPELRQGAFVEVEWERSPKVKRVVTWAGWRDRILAQPSNRDVVRTMEGLHPKDEGFAELTKTMTEFAKANVAEVEKAMPPDFEAWKNAERTFHLEVQYRLEDGQSAGRLEGTLSFAMERLWFRFRDSRGNETSLR